MKRKIMIDFEKLNEDWPSPFVARSEMERFTHGLYKPRSMSTFDARGDGLMFRITLGNKIVYLKKGCH